MSVRVNQEFICATIGRDLPRYFSFILIFFSHFDSQDLMYLLSQLLTSKMCVQSETIWRKKQ